MLLPHQATLDLAVPLSEVTFCAVDLETTGGSPRDSAITEVGAVKYRGGECLGTFSTLVDPGQPIPRFITHLTGIDDLMVAEAPPIDAVAPALLEFARGCVFVAHNARFDFGFVNVTLERLGYELLDGPAVCTARLARRVIWPDVPNVRLQTLAEYFRCSVRPNHRALPDAMACADVLHRLLEAGGRLGILTLGDLHEAVRSRSRPHFAKIRLADHLPHARGVYLFRAGDGRVLYVGKATDLRARVKSYFYGDPRKKIEDLLAETASVEALPCDSDLRALVMESRLIAREEPKYNRRGKTWRRYAYLRIDPDEAFPRLRVVRDTKRRHGVYLGPFGSTRRATQAKEALEHVFAIRRCTKPMTARTRFGPCALADLGRCAAPCDGRITPERYGELVRTLIASLSCPGGLLEALERRMAGLAADERYEEAALVRDRLRALADSLARSRIDAWLTAGSLTVVVEGGVALRLEGGSLEDPVPRPCPRERADELAAVRSWLSRRRPALQAADVPLAEPLDGGAALHRVLGLLKATSRDPAPPVELLRPPGRLEA
ncbi:MAG: DEDD exonuclease domain-containing protein [Actinomycetota bacterium]